MRRNSPILFIPIALYLFSGLSAFGQEVAGVLQQAGSQTGSQADPETRVPPEAAVQNPSQQLKPAESAGSSSTAKAIFTNLWADQKDIWSSPFRMNRDNAKWWAAFGVGTAALIATDRTAER